MLTEADRIRGLRAIVDGTDREALSDVGKELYDALAGVLADLERADRREVDFR